MPSMVIRACFIGGNHAGTPQTIHANIEGEFFCQWIFTAFVNQIELFQIGIHKPSGGLVNADLEQFNLIYKSSEDPLTKKFAFNICMNGLGRTRMIPPNKTCTNYH